MNTPAPGQPTPGRDPLDASIARVLETTGQEADAGRVWALALAQLHAETTKPVPQSGVSPQRRLIAAISVLAVVAAAVLFGVFFVTPSTSVAASPAQVLTSMRQQYDESIDRCYRIQMQGPEDQLERLSQLINDSSLLYTRGNRFYKQLAKGMGSVGKDADGHVWFAMKRVAAAQFEERDLPSSLQQLLAIRGLELPKLLDEVLKDFHLEWSNGEMNSRRILATRSGAALPFQIVEAELHVAPDSIFLDELRIVRLLPNDERVQITFTWIPGEPQDEAAYTARGHLNPNAPIYGADRPGLRLALLMQNLGETILRGW